MTNNQKILLGVGAVALAYWLYKRKGSGISRQAPSNPPQVGNKDCPEGQELILTNCIKAPCPKICADIPKSNPNLVTTTYTCKDGKKVSITKDITKAYTTEFVNPCGINGGILSSEVKK